MPEPSTSDVLTAMVAAFQPLLPGQVAGLPKPSMSVARAETRASGIGNTIGLSKRGSIAFVEQHAVRMKATMRFTLWGFVAVDADQAVEALTSSIFAQQTVLAGQGFLKLSFEGSSAAEESRAPIAWRRSADYEVLYEFPYEDVGGAVGLILPIQAREDATGAQWSVVGDLGRWDDQTAPTLSIRGPAQVTALAALAFFANPGLPPTGSVTISRTFDGAGAPASTGTVAAFLAQTTAPVAPARNVSVTTPSLSALLGLFSPDGTPIAMGDRDQNGVLDAYVPSHLVFPAPLLLPGVADRLELSYAQSKFDHTAVVYLRAVPRGS